MLSDAGLLHEQVALITGAGAGYGADTAKLFAQQGARVLVLDIDDALGSSVADEIVADGGAAHFLHADVRNAADLDAAVTFAERTYGRLDIAVANAGILGRAAFRATETVSDEDWADVLDVNLAGTFRTFRAAIPALRRAGGGTLSATSSVAGVFSVLQRAAYSASKGGVNALVRSLAVELAPDRIRANAIATGGLRRRVSQSRSRQFIGAERDRDMQYDAPDREWKSRMRFTNRDGIDEVAKAHLYLCSQLGDFVNGHTLILDGGFSMWNGT